MDDRLLRSWNDGGLFQAMLGKRVVAQFQAKDLDDGTLLLCESLLKQRDALLAAAKAVLETISTTDINGAVLWMRPPFQAAGVHETASERLAEVIDACQGDQHD